MKVYREMRPVSRESERESSASGQSDLSGDIDELRAKYDEILRLQIEQTYIINKILTQLEEVARIRLKGG